MPSPGGSASASSKATGAAEVKEHRPKGPRNQPKVRASERKQGAKPKAPAAKSKRSKLSSAASLPPGPEPEVAVASSSSASSAAAAARAQRQRVIKSTEFTVRKRARFLDDPAASSEHGSSSNGAVATTEPGLLVDAHTETSVTTTAKQRATKIKHGARKMAVARDVGVEGDDCGGSSDACSGDDDSSRGAGSDAVCSGDEEEDETPAARILDPDIIMHRSTAAQQSSDASKPQPEEQGNGNTTATTSRTKASTKKPPRPELLNIGSKRAASSAAASSAPARASWSITMQNVRYGSFLSFAPELAQVESKLQHSSTSGRGDWRGRIEKGGLDDDPRAGLGGGSSRHWLAMLMRDGYLRSGKHVADEDEDAADVASEGRGGENDVYDAALIDDSEAVLPPTTSAPVDEGVEQVAGVNTSNEVARAETGASQEEPLVEQQQQQQQQQHKKEVAGKVSRKSEDVNPKKFRLVCPDRPTLPPVVTGGEDVDLLVEAEKDLLQRGEAEPPPALEAEAPELLGPAAATGSQIYVESVSNLNRRRLRYAKQDSAKVEQTLLHETRKLENMRDLLGAPLPSSDATAAAAALTASATKSNKMKLKKTEAADERARQEATRAAEAEREGMVAAINEQIGELRRRLNEYEQKERDREQLWKETLAQERQIAHEEAEDLAAIENEKRDRDKQREVQEFQWQCEAWYAEQLERIKAAAEEKLENHKAGLKREYDEAIAAQIASTQEQLDATRRLDEAREFFHSEKAEWKKQLDALRTAFCEVRDEQVARFLWDEAYPQAAALFADAADQQMALAQKKHDWVRQDREAYIDSLKEEERRIRSLLEEEREKGKALELDLANLRAEADGLKERFGETERKARAQEKRPCEQVENIRTARAGEKAAAEQREKASGKSDERTLKEIKELRCALARAEQEKNTLRRELELAREQCSNLDQEVVEAECKLSQYYTGDGVGRELSQYKKQILQLHTQLYLSRVARWSEQELLNASFAAQLYQTQQRCYRLALEKTKMEADGLRLQTHALLVGLVTSSSPSCQQVPRAQGQADSEVANELQCGLCRTVQLNWLGAAAKRKRDASRDRDGSAGRRREGDGDDCNIAGSSPNSKRRRLGQQFEFSNWKSEPGSSEPPQANRSSSQKPSSTSTRQSGPLNLKQVHAPESDRGRSRRTSTASELNAQKHGRQDCDASGPLRIVPFETSALLGYLAPDAPDFRRAVDARVRAVSGPGWMKQMYRELVLADHVTPQQVQPSDELLTKCANDFDSETVVGWMRDTLLGLKNSSAAMDPHLVRVLEDVVERSSELEELLRRVQARDQEAASERSKWAHLNNQLEKRIADYNKKIDSLFVSLSVAGESGAGAAASSNMNGAPAPTSGAATSSSSCGEGNASDGTAALRPGRSARLDGLFFDLVVDTTMHLDFVAMESIEAALQRVLDRNSVWEEEHFQEDALLLSARPPAGVGGNENLSRQPRTPGHDPQVEKLCDAAASANTKASAPDRNGSRSATSCSFLACAPYSTSLQFHQKYLSPVLAEQRPHTSGMRGHTNGKLRIQVDRHSVPMQDESHAIKLSYNSLLESLAAQVLALRSGGFSLLQTASEARPKSSLGVAPAEQDGDESPPEEIDSTERSNTKGDPAALTESATDATKGARVVRIGPTSSTFSARALSQKLAEWSAENRMPGFLAEVEDLERRLRAAGLVDADFDSRVIAPARRAARTLADSIHSGAGGFLEPKVAESKNLASVLEQLLAAEGKRPGGLCGRVETPAAADQGRTSEACAFMKLQWQLPVGAGPGLVVPTAEDAALENCTKKRALFGQEAKSTQPQVCRTPVAPYTRAGRYSTVPLPRSCVPFRVPAGETLSAEQELLVQNEFDAFQEEFEDYCARIVASGRQRGYVPEETFVLKGAMGTAGTKRRTGRENEVGRPTTSIADLFLVGGAPPKAAKAYATLNDDAVGLLPKTQSAESAVVAAVPVQESRGVSGNRSAIPANASSSTTKDAAVTVAPVPPPTYAAGTSTDPLLPNAPTRNPSPETSPSLDQSNLLYSDLLNDTGGRAGADTGKKDSGVAHFPKSRPQLPPKAKAPPKKTKAIIIPGSAAVSAGRDLRQQPVARNAPWVDLPTKGQVLPPPQPVVLVAPGAPAGATITASALPLPAVSPPTTTATPTAQAAPAPQRLNAALLGTLPQVGTKRGSGTGLQNLAQGGRNAYINEWQSEDPSRGRSASDDLTLRSDGS